MVAENFLILEVESLLGTIRRIPCEPVLEGWHPAPETKTRLHSQVYEAHVIGDGISFSLSPGALADFSVISADFLLEGSQLAVFVLELGESVSGRTFGYSFGLLNACSARLRLPLEAVSQNRWMYPREGALLKPRCQGDRVDLEKVDRVSLKIERKADVAARFHMTPVVASQAEPPLLAEPYLPQGVLLDDLGQSTLHDWEGKSGSLAEVKERLHQQHHDTGFQTTYPEFSKWGGWLGKNFGASGYFRTHHDGERWWLVDPDGYAFWSAGVDCVRVDTDANIQGLESALAWLPEADGEFAPAFGPEGSVRQGKMFNYLAANLVRTFGASDWYRKWAEIVIAELRRMRFNTVANWSDWEIARQAGMPYVRPLGGSTIDFPTVYRDFPDVFHPDFATAAVEFAQPLKKTAQDPAFIGYFLMNEPTWGFAGESPAVGMLFNTAECYSRSELAAFLRERYGSEQALSESWALEGGDRQLAFAEVASGEWALTLSPRAIADLDDFSEIMVERFFGTLSRTCREVDPNHLNLGIRYYTIPPKWALKGMRYFDVFSMNCYKTRLPADEMAQISQLMSQPIMIGEWHFGALDVGLPASGIGHVPDQEGRGKAYRVYLEDAAAKPWCVGVHYFILYDQSALGRFDGENYNIGFLDVCHRPYQPLVEAAIASHERMYAVASGDVDPYDDEPQYLPLLFL